MIKRWKELDSLHCVKSLGIWHKIAHFLSVAKLSRCFMEFGKWMM